MNTTTLNTTTMNTTTLNTPMNTTTMNIIKSIPSRILKKIEPENDFYKLSLNINNIDIQIITNFKTFCFSNSPIKNIDVINISFISMSNVSIKNIVSILDKNLNTNTNTNKTPDIFNLYVKMDTFTKFSIDYSKISFQPNTLLDGNVISYLLKETQLNKMIMNEINSINSNKDYLHFIKPYNNSMYKYIITLFINNNTIFGKQIKEIELLITFDSKGYPYIAPKIEYLQRNASIDFILSLMDLDILKQSNWTHTISLESLIISIVQQLETLKDTYIYDNYESNPLRNEIINLASVTKMIRYNKIDIHFDIKRFKPTIITQWIAGTGYGSNSDINKVNISQFINTKKSQEETVVCLNKIYNIIKEEEKINTENIYYLSNYILSNIASINLLEFQKKQSIYIIIFNIMDILLNIIDQDTINDIFNNINCLYEEIDYIHKNYQGTLQ